MALDQLPSSSTSCERKRFGWIVQVLRGCRLRIVYDIRTHTNHATHAFVVLLALARVSCVSPAEENFTLILNFPSHRQFVSPTRRRHRRQCDRFNVPFLFHSRCWLSLRRTQATLPLPERCTKTPLRIRTFVSHRIYFCFAQRKRSTLRQTEREERKKRKKNNNNECAELLCGTMLVSSLAAAPQYGLQNSQDKQSKGNGKI